MLPLIDAQLNRLFIAIWIAVSY